MSAAQRLPGWLFTFVPFLDWIGQLRRAYIRPDLEAGLIGAILILPQSIALATLAGMPPEYGIYTSIIPVVVASLWGSSYHTLSGPNTAVCVLIAASVAPFASVGTSDYIGFVLALTLMAGVIELLVGLLRIGSVLDFISQTVISGIVLAVGLVIIVSALPAFFGVLSNLYEPFFVKLWQVGHDLTRANPYALAVGVVTVGSGLLLKRLWRRYALVLAVLLGSLFSYGLNAYYGPATTGIELLGRLQLDLLPLSAPHFSLESMYVLKELLTSAFAIAFLSLMQTIVISRSLAMKSGQTIDTNQEIVGQGLSNIVAPFFSSFAGSGSFNRSAAHYDAGAKTPLAAVYASVILAVVVFAGAPVIVYLPMPAVAGALILVGLGLIDMKEVKRMLKARQEAAIFFITFIVALGFGLNSGVFAGVIMSLVVYLWFASMPNIKVTQQYAQDGRRASVVTIDGNLFFGSVNFVENRLGAIVEEEGESGLLLLRTDHVTYMDMPGVAMIAAEAKRRRDRGSELYLYLTREGVDRLLEDSGLLDVIGRERIIRAEEPHPMKKVFMPYSEVQQAATPPRASVTPESPLRSLPPVVSRQQRSITLADNEELLNAICDYLGSGRLLNRMSAERLRGLIAGQRLRLARPGTTLVAKHEGLRDYLVLFDGELEILRGWKGSDRVDGQLFTAEVDEGVLVPLVASDEWLSVHVMSDAHYLLLDGDSLDQALGQGEQLVAIDPNTPLEVSAFRHLPAENLEAAYTKLQPRKVEAGEVVIRQGDPGDAYYLLEEGEAEVLRTDPFTQQTHFLAHLRPGQSFGEDALLQNIHRSATVRMLTGGLLQVLTKADFEQLVRPSLVYEINAQEARQWVEQGGASWIDCRFEMEYQAARLAGARHLPLDLLRNALGQLPNEGAYIVYCRTGKRSAAAVYLLRSAGFEAFSLTGGLRDWPFELER